MNDNAKYNILIAVLNWGLGHATRMVPLIDLLMQRGVRVTLASSGVAGNFLKLRYPELAYYELPDYQIRYARKGSMAMAIMRNWPSIAAGMKAGKERVAEIARKEHIDVLISDNRYGCFLKEVKSVLITHQVCPLAPGGFALLQPCIHWQIRKLIHQFDECWIPDTAERPLSGRLSDPSRLKLSVRFLGMMSRFGNRLEHTDKKYDWLAIISGPEPQRSILQKRFVDACVRGKKCGAVLAGKPGTHEFMERGIRIIPHLPDEEFLRVISESRNVLMRPGYSSLMDLLNIGSGALLVPTPGQTEQLYLAGRMQRHHQFAVQSQSNLDLMAAEEKLANTVVSDVSSSSNMLAGAVDSLIAGS